MVMIRMEVGGGEEGEIMQIVWLAGLHDGVLCTRGRVEVWERKLVWVSCIFLGRERVNVGRFRKGRQVKVAGL